MGSLSLLQRIFPTQGLNPGLPHCRWIHYQLSQKGSPRILEWVAYPFSSESSWPRNWTGVSCIAGGFFANWAIREAHFQYTNIKRNEKQKEQRIHHQIGCLTNIQTYTVLGSPMSQHIWSPIWEKVPGSMSAPWTRLQKLQFGISAYNTKMQTNIIISLWANSSSGFMLVLLALSCKTWNVVKSGAWLARDPPGAQQFQDLSPILSIVLQVSHSPQAFTHSHSQSGQCPGRLEARSEACSALSLKPK